MAQTTLLIKTFFCYILFTSVIACQNNTNNNNMEKSYGWEACSGAPLGYPIAVYSGGFIQKDGQLVSLYGGISTARSPWGNVTGGRLDYGGTIPHRLEVTWISFAEDCEYEISTDLDYHKIEQYFEEGTLNRNAYGDIIPDKYDQIVAGFAPGGVVSVWVSDGGANVREVGHYQGKKVHIPREETENLEPSEKNWFSSEYRKEIMRRPAAVPLEIQEKNKNKPIPYGLWDRYRNRYHWKPVFTLPEGAELYDVSFTYLNGQTSDLLYPDVNTLPEEYKESNVLPRFAGIQYTTKEGVNKVGVITFDEEEIMKKFEQFSPEDTLKLEFRVNRAETMVVAYLEGKGKLIGINDNTETEVRTIKNKF